MKKSNTEEQSTETPTPEASVAPNTDGSPAQTPAGDAKTDNPEVEEKLEEEESDDAKAQENWERFLRVTAEFDNFRKRAAREKEEAIRYSNQNLLERLLPVLDSFDMAITAASVQNGEASKSFMEGINLVLQQFKSVLTEAGLEEIDAQGKPFDPNLHEAVSQMETDEFEEGHVAQQVRKGYRLRDRLVRASSVIVAKKPNA